MLILGTYSSQRLFSPIGSTGNMDTVPKSDRYRHWKIGRVISDVKYDCNNIDLTSARELLLPGLHKRRTHAGATRAQVYTVVWDTTLDQLPASSACLERSNRAYHVSLAASSGTCIHRRRYHPSPCQDHAVSLLHYGAERHPNPDECARSVLPTMPTRSHRFDPSSTKNNPLFPLISPRLALPACLPAWYPYPYPYL